MMPRNKGKYKPTEFDAPFKHWRADVDPDEGHEIIQVRPYARKKDGCHGINDGRGKGNSKTNQTCPKLRICSQLATWPDALMLCEQPTENELRQAVKVQRPWYSIWKSQLKPAGLVIIQEKEKKYDAPEQD